MPLRTMRKQHAVLIASLLALCFATPAKAATISWGSAANVSNAGDVETSGTPIEAINATGSGSSTTVNGVTFAASDLLLNRSFAGDTLAGATTGNAALDVLIGSFDFGNGTSTSVLLGGGLLVPGAEYLLQVFFTDRRGCCNARNMTFGDGLGNQVDLNATGAGFGQFAVGTFHADATTQTLSLSTNGFGNAHITGYQIRAIPEPSSGLLVLVGLALAAGRRRSSSHAQGCAQDASTRARPLF